MAAKVIKSVQQSIQGVSVSLSHSSHSLSIKPLLNTSISKPFEFSAYRSRENCHCPECLLYPSHHRRVYKTNPNVTIKSVSNSEEDDKIEIEWSDNHRGYLSISQLSDEPKLLEPRLWDASTFTPNRYDYNELISTSDSSVLSEFYNDFNIFGLCIICNSPLDTGVTLDLSSKLGLRVHNTHHGRAFVVEDSNIGLSSFERSNQAYTNHYLACHTDVPHMVDIPHGFIFHCISAAPSGGESFYCDGWNIAKYMEMKYKNEFDLLCTKPIFFRDNQKHVGNGEGGWDIFCQRRTIELYPSMKIAYNNGVRYSLHWPQIASTGFEEGEVEGEDKDYRDEVLNALQLLGDLTEKDEFRFEYQMKCGDINVFNNYRIMHGRRAFEGYRKMEGNFFQFTEFVTENGPPLELPNDNGMTIYDEKVKARMNTTF